MGGPRSTSIEIVPCAVCLDGNEPLNATGSALGWSNAWLTIARLRFVPSSVPSHLSPFPVTLMRVILDPSAETSNSRLPLSGRPARYVAPGIWCACATGPTTNISTSAASNDHGRITSRPTRTFIARPPPSPPGHEPLPHQRLSLSTQDESRPGSGPVVVARAALETRRTGYFNASGGRDFCGSGASPSRRVSVGSI